MTDKKDILRAKLARDLIRFGRTIDPKAFYMQSAPFHYEIASLLMDRSIKKLMIEAPRGVGKSKLNVFYVLHHLIYDKGDKVIIIQSKTRKEAINRLSDIKDIFEYNQVFRQLYGYYGSQAAASWREDKYQAEINGNRATIFALGTGQPLHGVLVRNTRITLYLLDDPEDEDNTLTKDQMDKNMDKFLGALPGLDVRNGRVIVIGTPIRGGCIVTRLDGATGWTTRVFPAMYDDGTLLWAEKYSKETLEALEQEYSHLGTPRKYYSDYLCKIKDESEQLFKSGDIQYYDGVIKRISGFNFLNLTNLNGSEVNLTIPVNIFLGIDPASSTKNTADYSVTMLVAYDSDSNLYVLPYYRARVAPTQHAEQILETIKNYKPMYGFVESTAYQEMLRDYLIRKMREENTFLPGLEIKFTSKTEKTRRIESMHYFFSNKKIFLKKDMMALINELAEYPNSKHDDTLDGLYYATRRLITPDHSLAKELTQEEKFIASRAKNNNTSWMAA